MRLRGMRQSRNVEDRRGRSLRGGGVRLGGFGLLAVLAIGYFTGVDVMPLLTGQPEMAQEHPVSPSEERAGDFAARVLASTEDVWARIFQEQLGRDYRPPILVLFSGVTPSPCGGASGATGPFYCPADQKAYLDTEFFDTLERQLGVKGDFAAAYVVAHEVAHHVQNELGILPKVEEARQRANEAEANALTVRLELQADCLAGVWAQEVDGLLDAGDIDEAVDAASRIGDDYLQKRAGQVPQPHTFTHGTSAQRVRWFVTGYDSGDIRACDTFAARSP